MHTASMQEMTAILNGWPQAGARVLDVGSLDVNGSYRRMVTRQGWHYTGLDVVPGKNVDVVTADPYRYPFDAGHFDVVISGSAMEHVPAIWRWVPELVRVLRPGGLLAIITHIQWELDHYPPDCWRILPDGMRYLFDETRQLVDYEIRVTNGGCDICATAVKQAPAKEHADGGEEPACVS